MFPTTWHAQNFVFGHDVTQLWTVMRAGKSLITFLSRYLVFVLVPHFRATSVFGFALLLNMLVQV